jgi:hypothetical protein
MDRAGNRRGFPRRCGPAAPLSRTDLIGMQLVKRPHKGRQLDEHSIERRARVSPRLAGNRARGHVGNSAHVLVGAARIGGEPFHLYCAASPNVSQRGEGSGDN